MSKRNLVLGIFAHVDAGKTTLSEALLYQCGVRRTLGRVDHGDAFLDTHSIERQRGITVFSKQALFSTEKLDITLVDTPGHTDFGTEAERVMPILDCAIMVVSGTDGVQAHTVTLWELLARYGVPVLVFVNKTDLPGLSREEIMARLQQLDAGCVDASDSDRLAETAAMCDERLLEHYLETGTVAKEALRRLVGERKLFPCCFGSALKLEGVEKLLQLLDDCAPYTEPEDSFGAQVYKISRDPRGERLTWLKVTGGALSVRTALSYANASGEQLQEKIVQLRLYSGDKFTTPETVYPGQLCAVTGLSATYAGQGFGSARGAEKPMLEPVMTYKVHLPKGCDPVAALQKIRQLEEEDPQLRIFWDAQGKQIHAQIMGKVQLEVLRSIVAERFGMEITFDSGRIFYKETIENTVEGVGHFEPLRHYAEVHLLLEPLPRGSGLVFDTVCPTDVLEGNFQRLVLTHLEEKSHLGVLTGAPITDMKITLLVGRAHVKHTEGGDFRQATYRAVRQGLMQAKSVLLEPWYAFTLTVPTEQIGRAITDIRAMYGELDTPENGGDVATVQGVLPASELKDYPEQVAAYTRGLGQLQLRLEGYRPCHNSERIIEEVAYDPEADLENTPDSVFCDHGAGVTVKWDRVQEYMHLDSGRKENRQEAPVLLTRNLSLGDKELEAIMEREFGPQKTRLYHAPENRPAAEQLTIRPPKDTALIVDGYNIIFADPELSAAAQSDLDAARRSLCDQLSSYAGYRKCYTVVVFDGYKVKGTPGEKQPFHNIQVVYTKENETGDAYIEALVARIGRNYNVRVATSDGLVQLSSLRSGVLRMSARELHEELERTRREMDKHFKNN